MEQGLSLCPDFVVQGTHENKLTMKISQITVVGKQGVESQGSIHITNQSSITASAASTYQTYSTLSFSLRVIGKLLDVSC